MTGRIIDLRGRRAPRRLAVGMLMAAAVLIGSSALPAVASAATQVSSGYDHSCELFAGGTIKCWGGNYWGQLGANIVTSTAGSSTPVPVSGITTATQVSAGSYFACATLSAGSAQCWGNNGYGQLGNGTTIGAAAPVTVKSSSTATLTGLSQVDAGGNHACALISSTGGARCWGYNGYGQLGDGTTTDRSYGSLAVKTTAGGVTSTLTGLTQVVAGQDHSCGLLSTGTVKCWGLNSNGQLGNNSTTAQKTGVTVSGLTSATATATQITAGANFTCALLSDGTVKCWGYNGYGQLGDGTTTDRKVPVFVSGLSGVTAIAAGPTSVCATTSDAALYCWGDNGSGQLGDGTLQNQPFPTQVRWLSSVSAGSPGGSNGCALLTDGSVKCWGSLGSGLGYDYTTRSTPLAASSTSGATFTSIAAGGAAACGVVTDGTVRCWGDPSGTWSTTWSTLLLGNSNLNSRSAITVSGIQNAKQIALSSWHACAAIAGGSVMCWGYDNSEQLGDSTASSQPVTARGVTLASPDKAGQIATGGWHSCAIVAGGAIKCWGSNNYGELGDPQAAASGSAPVYVKTSTGGNLTGVLQIAAGSSSTCAILTGGKVACWGNNRNKQLGNDYEKTSTYESAIPLTVAGLANVTQITIGGEHACALINDGTVRCWGSGSYGELGDGTGLDSSVPLQVAGLKDVKQVEAGDSHTCATTNSGSVWCWGRNDNGQLGDGTANSRLTPVLIRQLSASQVSGGRGHTCSIASDGSASCWGDDSFGQLGDGYQPAPIATGLAFTSPPTALSNSTTASVGFTSDLQSTIECALDLTAWSACTSVLSLTGLSEGNHVIGIRQGSADGLPYGALYSAWTIDVTAPAPPTIGNQPKAITNATSISLTLNGESDGRFSCSLDGATSTSCNSPFDASSLGEGTHKFSVLQTDAAGNTGDPTTINWTVDVTAPTAPVITGAPSTATNQTSQSLNFSGEDSATFQCSLDSTTAYSACKSPISFSSLKDGSHTLRVKQTDAAGNVGPIGSATWTVDTQAPAAPIVTGIPIKPTNRTSQAASIAGEAGASFQCSLDSGDWASCPASPSFSSLSEGSHTLSVRQTDIAGNTGTAATLTWSIDLTPPAVPTISGTPTKPSNSTTQSFSLSGEPGATFQCALDNSTYSSCSAAPSFPSLRDGSHTLSVKQTDVAGNQGDAASTSWTVDSTPPAAPGIAGAPTKPTTQTSQSLTLSGEDGASFQCALDSTTLSACSSVQNFSSLRDGSHTFYAKQTDTASNTSVMGSVSWTVDTTAPAKPTVSGAPTNPTKATTQSFAIVGEANATFQCSLDSGDFTNCSSAPSFSSLQDGDHTLTVKQTDLAGNTGPTSSVTWTVDTIAPDPPIIAGAPSRPTSSQTQAMTLSGESKVTFTCSLDGGPFTTCSTSPSFNGLREGSHSLAVKQTDQAGNTSAAASVTWTVDITPPSAPVITGTPTKPSNSASQSFGLSGESGAIFSCALDNTVYSVCVNPVSYDGLKDGSHTLKVRQTDQAGNASIDATTTWTVDLTPPAAPVISGTPTKPTRATTQAFGLSGENGATFQCSLDSGNFASCGNAPSYSSLADGDHTLTVRQTDVAGNTGVTASATWTVDTTAPAPPAIAGAPTKPSNSSSQSLTFSGEQGATFQCSIDSTTAYSTCSGSATYTNLSEGSHTFRVKQTDVAGNAGTAASATWTVDLTAPAAPSITGTPTKPTNSTSQTLSFTGEDGASFQCSIDSTTAYSPCSGSATYTSLTEGSHTFRVKQTDVAGNTGTAATTTWTVDLTAPAAPSITGTPTKPTNSTNQALTFGGENGATFQCSLDGGDYSTCSASANFANLAEGSHTLAVRQTDVAGNTGLARTASWTVDVTSPATPSIGGTPTKPTNSATQAFVLSGEDGASFQCSLDSGTYSACTSAPSFPGLRDGSHTLSVKQTDRAGNTSDPATATWTVDLTAPAAPSITGTPTKPTNSTSQTLSFAGEDGASFQCSIDSTTAYTPCSGSATYTSLTEGSHTFRVKQTDVAGNTGTAATTTWSVDTTAPSAPTVSGVPTKPVNSVTQTLTFSGENGATFQCSLDGGDYAACDPSTGFSNLVEGQHTLLVRQTDVAGNTGSAKTASWTIDRTALPPSISGLPTKPTRQVVAAPAFSGESGASFQCSLDNADWQACTSPRSLSDLTEAQHTFRVRQTDIAGNMSDPASATWTVDLTAPGAPAIGGAPTKPTNQTTQAFTLSGEDSATFQCSLDGAAAANCASSPSFSSLKAGSHTLVVTQTDQAGNTGPSSQVNWTIDLTPPEMPGVTGAPVGPTNTKTQSFTFTGEAGASFQCSLDAAAFSTCTNPTAFSDLADGQHTLAVKQTDVAGNVGNATNVSWTVDRTALPPTLGALPANYTTLRAANPTFTGESGASFQCSLDNAAWQACTSPRALAGLGEAQHTFKVRQTDLAGNVSDPATTTWTVDVTAPAAPTVTGTPTKPTNQTSQAFSLSGEDLATFSCSVDGGAFSGCQASLALTSLKAGAHKLAVKQTDAAGNTGAARTVNWTIDLTAPTAPALSGAPSGLVGTASASVSFTSEAGASAECRNDLGDWSACASPLKLSSLPDGVHTLEVRQTDVAGNTGPVARAAWTVIAALPDATPQVSAGQAHSCAIVGTTGTAGCWGSSDSGRTTLPAGKYLAVSVGGSHTCSITLAGALGCFGSNTQGQTVAPTGVFGRISTGQSHSCAIKTDGTLLCWGANDKGQSTVPPGTYTNVSAGSEHTCAITVAEELTCWGNGDSDRLKAPQGKFIDVSSGSDSSCAISDSGSLSCWGSDVSGKSNPPAGTFRQVSVGRAHACALRQDGQVLCWGSGSSGQTSVPGGSYTWVSSGSSHSCAIRESGRVQCWGDDSSGQSTVPDIYPPAAPVITSAPAARTASKSASVVFTTVKGATVQCSFDDSAWAACASPRALTGLTDGRHELKIRQLSSTGNASVPASAAWEVDTVGPAAPTITSAPAAATSSSAATIQFTPSEGPDRVQCRLDGKAWVNCPPPSFGTSQLADGPHKLEIRQTDDVGNIGAVRLVSWTVDTIAPKAPALGGVPAARTKSTGAQITFTGEAGGTYECSLDSGDWGACQSPRAIANLPEGSHSLSVRQTDAAGNTGATTTGSWVVDTTAPTIDSLTVTRSGRNSIITSSSRAQTDPATQVEWSNSATAPKATAAPVATQTLKWAASLTIANQATIKWVRFADSAGNWTSWLQTG